MAETRSRREWFGCPHAQTASYCASRVCQLVAASRSTVRAPNTRLATCWPAARPGSEPVKKTLRYPPGDVSGRPTAAITSGAQPCMPLDPCGADDASTALRMADGRTSAISWATKLPIEKPSRSTYVEVREAGQARAGVRVGRRAVRAVTGVG